MVSFLSQLIDDVASAVETVIVTATDVAADFIETAGSAVQEGLDALLPGYAIARYAGDVVTGVTDLVAADVKWLVESSFTGLGPGAWRILGGFLGFDGALIGKGIADILGGLTGGQILLAGKGVALTQRVLGVERSRKLDPKEEDFLRAVFYNSMSLYNVRVVEGRTGVLGTIPLSVLGLSDIQLAPFTLGNTVYMQDSTNPATLVHECVHVWQYQNVGARYAAEALGAQAIFGRSGPGSAYDWQADLARGYSTWEEFNLEAQAELIENVWDLGVVSGGGASERQGSGVFFDLPDTQALFPDARATFAYPNIGGTDYTDLATDAVGSLRERINLRWSQSLVPLLNP